MGKTEEKTEADVVIAESPEDALRLSFVLLCKQYAQMGEQLKITSEILQVVYGQKTD